MLEVPEDDVPPEEIWHHEEQLTEWFKAVQWRREHPNEKPISYDDDDGDNRVMVNQALRRRR